MAFPSAAIPGRKAYLRSSSNSSATSSQALMAELPTQAEVWRQEAIETLRQAHEDAQTSS